MKVFIGIIFLTTFLWSCHKSNLKTSSSEVSAQPSSIGKLVGYDPGMHKACAKSPDEFGINGLVINKNSDCSFGSSHWLIGNQAEIHGASSCVGIGAQSYPWSQSFENSPHLAIVVHGDKQKTWELKTDWSNGEYPCHDPTARHWHTIMQHIHHGGKLPDIKSKKASMSVNLWYDDFVPDGTARLMIGAEVLYSAAGTNTQVVRQIEINVARTNWRDHITSGPHHNEIDFYTKGHPGLSQYIQINGDSRGYSLEKKKWKKIHINLHEILNYLIQIGRFEKINQNQPIFLKSINVATETTGSAAAHVKLKNFRMFE